MVGWYTRPEEYALIETRCNTNGRAQLLVSSIKGEVKEKHSSIGRNFSSFSAHLIEQDLF